MKDKEKELIDLKGKDKSEMKKKKMDAAMPTKKRTSPGRYGGVHFVE